MNYQKTPTHVVNLMVSMNEFETQQAYSVVRALIALTGPNLGQSIKKFLSSPDAFTMDASARNELRRMIGSFEVY